MNMLWYSYNNIIIVSNVIMLEFLSARFVHPSVQLVTIFIFFKNELERKNNGI